MSPTNKDTLFLTLPDKQRKRLELLHARLQSTGAKKSRHAVSDKTTLNQWAVQILLRNADRIERDIDKGR